MGKIEISFCVPGEPGAKGRPRFSSYGGYVHSYTPAATANYENLVKVMYLEAAEGRRFEDDEPLCITIDAMFPIPKSFSKKKRNNALMDAIRPIVKKDFDNIAKAVCDALNNVAYKDDSRIVAATVTKRYSDTPCVLVKISSWGLPTN